MVKRFSKRYLFLYELKNIDVALFLSPILYLSFYQQKRTKMGYENAWLSKNSCSDYKNVKNFIVKPHFKLVQM